MCSPLIIPIAMLAVSAAGTAVAVKGQMDARESANKAADYNAQIQNRNAEIENMKAADAINRGNIAASEHMQNVRAMIGTQRAEGGASGAAVDSGTNLNVTEDTAQFGKLDALTIQSNAAREAWTNTNSADNFSANASLISATKSSPAAAGVGSALTGISALGQQIYAGKKEGVF